MPTASERYDEAIQLQQAGDLSGAVGKLEQLIADVPGFALAHTALSVYYGKLGRHEEALSHANKVCELEPNDPFSYMSKSILSQRADRRPEAEAAMSMAMEKQWAARRPQT